MFKEQSLKEFIKEPWCFICQTQIIGKNRSSVDDHFISQPYVEFECINEDLHKKYKLGYINAESPDQKPIDTINIVLKSGYQFSFQFIRVDGYADFPKVDRTLILSRDPHFDYVLNDMTPLTHLHYIPEIILNHTALEEKMALLLHFM
jgi:hypothetical protein